MALKKAEIKWRFILQKAALTLACIFIGLPLLLGSVALVAFSPPIMEHWLLFQPMRGAVRKLDRTISGAAPRHVHFEDSFGNTLHGVFYKKPNTSKVILVSHGNGGCMDQREWLAEFLLRTDASVFMYDYAGYGSSTGSPSIAALMDDGMSAYNYVTKTLKYPPSQVVLFGESLGTTVSARLSERVPCSGIVLECPIYSIKKIFYKISPLANVYPDWMWREEGLDTSRALSKTHAPLLMVAGTKDHTTFCDLSDELYNVAVSPKQYIRIEGAGHGDKAMMTSPVYRNGIVAFVNRLN